MVPPYLVPIFWDIESPRIRDAFCHRLTIPYIVTWATTDAVLAAVLDRPHCHLGQIPR
jgi:hypothetical protein